MQALSRPDIIVKTHFERYFTHPEFVVLSPMIAAVIKQYKYNKLVEIVIVLLAEPSIDNG